MNNKFLSLTVAAIAVLCISTSIPSRAEEAPGAKMEAADFLKVSRRPPLEESWAKMQGEISHKRGTADTVKHPIYLGLRFTPERTLAQVVANSNEFYLIGQSYSDKPESTSVIVNRPENEKSVLAYCGIRPEDLTLSFMYWPFQKEMKSDEISGFPCRVFQLQSPDKKEYAVVYISTQYFFPLKVEWFKTGQAEKDGADRTLEIKSFKKDPKEDFWLVNTLMISGAGFKTKIDFTEASAGYTKNGIPQDLFQKTPDGK